MAKLFFFAAALFALFSVSCSNNEDNLSIQEPTSRYRYKAETEAYIEASRKETFSVCPNKEIQGTWVSEHSVSLNAENCLSVQAPKAAGTFRILFLQNSGRTDTIQVLVDQSYIQMGDYSHKIWIPSSEPEYIYYGDVIEINKREGRYESKKYDQPLIVDKTEFTLGDALYYSEFGIKIPKWIFDPYYLPEGVARIGSVPIHYPPSEDMKTSMRPYVDDYNVWRFANMRSKLEGLDTAYIHVLGEKGGIRLALDTNASGYRFPSKDEWAMLMRAGASTHYYWGDEEDSLTVSRYSLVRPFGYTQHKVAQKLPNAFGLYDMISPNNTHDAFNGQICIPNQFAHQMPECRFIAGEIARQVEIGNGMPVLVLYNGSKEVSRQTHGSDFGATSFRLMRKTPKMYKLEKF